MKKVLSLAIVFALLFTMVPVLPSYAAESDDMYSPTSAMVSTGVTADEVKVLVDITDDFFSSRSGATFDEKVRGFFEAYLNEDDTLNESTLYDILTMYNGVTGSAMVSLATTVRDLDTGSKEDIVADLVSVKSEFPTLINNLNAKYYQASDFSGENTRIGTYGYYLMKKLQTDKIATFDDTDDSLEFTFASNLTDTDVVNGLEDATFNLNEYVQKVVDFSHFPGITFDDVDQGLEDYLNDELDSYLLTGNYSAEDIANALDAVGLMTMPDDSSSTGGSTSGGSSGGSTGGGAADDDETPAPEPEDDEELVNDAEEAQEAMDDPDATAEEITAAVTKLTETASDLMDREDVDAEEAAAIVKKVVEETIAKAMTSENTTQKEKDRLKKTAQKLASKAAKKAGVVNVKAGTNVTKGLVDEAIRKSKAAIQGLEGMLNASGLSNRNKPLKAMVTLKSDDEESDVSLSADVIASLKGQNTDLAIGNKGSSIVVPSETLDSIEEGETIEISSKTTSENVNQELNDAAGEKYKFVKTRDIVVNKKKADGSSEQLTKLSLSFDLSDYEGDTDQVAVLVRNDETGEFELLSSWIVDGELQFKSPHYSYYTLADYTPGFDDVTGHWGEKVINKMAAKGIVKGRSDETFDPQGSITRAEFITMLMNAFDYEAEVFTSFNDTTANDWFYTPVNVGRALGLVNGVGGNEFNPNASITRQDMVVMMARFFEEETGEALFATKDAFNDSEASSNYARLYINGAAEVDIVSGDGEGFKPLNNATRTEALKMIDNLLIYLK